MTNPTDDPVALVDAQAIEYSRAIESLYRAAGHRVLGTVHGQVIIDHRLAGRIIEAGPAGGARNLDGGGCIWHVVVLWVHPEVAAKLAEHVDGEVLLECVGLPGDRLTSAPARPAPAELEPAFNAHRGGA